MAGKYPNWFKQTAQPNFEQHLLPLAGQPDLRFLQLGAYTGDATVWLRENILTGAGSLLQDVDTWEGSDEEGHKNLDFNEVSETYQNKISKYENIWWYKGTTFKFLSHVFGCDSCESFSYDFIYVDADHTTVGVLLDAELSWPLLKSGGIMAFDDYTWGDHYPMHQRPKPGIDLFLLRHSGEYDVLAVNLQYWIRKH
jgi:hypothetical protein